MSDQIETAAWGIRFQYYANLGKVCSSGYIVLWLLILVFLPASANAVSKYALVIGNSQYSNTPLANPANDASDMVKVLRGLDFRIYENRPLLDLELEEFERAVIKYADSLPSEAIAVFYYAGHGISDTDDNYLLPINSGIHSKFDLRARAVSVKKIQEILKSQNRKGANIILLDACRNNPLGTDYRGEQGGLAKLGTGNIARGSFIGYAADEGQVAADGSGRNGIYTEQILVSLRTNPDRSIELIHTEIAGNVFEKTRFSQTQQLPVSENKLTGQVCMGLCAGYEIPFGEVTVVTEPADAEIKILNIDQPYADGMRLEAGMEYEFLVSKPGYKDWQRNIRLRKGSQIVSALLERKMSTRKKMLYTALGVLGAGVIYSLLDSDPVPPEDVSTTLILVPPE